MTCSDSISLSNLRVHHIVYHLKKSIIMMSFSYTAWNRKIHANIFAMESTIPYTDDGHTIRFIIHTHTNAQTTRLIWHSKRHKVQTKNRQHFALYHCSIQLAALNSRALAGNSMKRIFHRVEASFHFENAENVGSNEKRHISIWIMTKFRLQSYNRIRIQMTLFFIVN